MRYLQEKAIILRNRDYGEADRLVAFLTEEHGKVVGIAKHARKSKKRFVNSLDIFNLVDIEYGEKSYPGLVFIKSARLRESFPGLRETVLKLSCAGLVAEAVNESVPERDAQPQIYHLLRMTLTQMEKIRDTVNVVCLSLWKLLVLLGLSPRLDGCIICKRRISSRDGWVIDYALGGIVCAGHRPRKGPTAIINRGSITLLERARNTEMTKLWRFRVHQDEKLSVLKMLVEYLQFHIDKPLRSVQVICQLGYDICKSTNGKRHFNNRNTALSC